MMNRQSRISKPKCKPLRREELWIQLGNAIHLRSAQDQVLWSIFGVFWAANALLLIALFPGGRLPTYTIGMVISTVGIVMSIIWHTIQERALGNIRKYEELMKKVENNLRFESKYAVSSQVNLEDYQKYLGKGMRARQLMPACSLGAAILWSAALIFFIVKQLF